MTAVINAIKRASALTQEAALMLLPHGLQATARRNALQATIREGVRRAERLEAEAAVTVEESTTARGRHFAAASG